MYAVVLHVHWSKLHMRAGHMQGNCVVDDPFHVISIPLYSVRVLSEINIQVHRNSLPTQVPPGKATVVLQHEVQESKASSSGARRLHTNLIARGEESKGNAFNSRGRISRKQFPTPLRPKPLHLTDMFFPHKMWDVCLSVSARSEIIRTCWSQSWHTHRDRQVVHDQSCKDPLGDYAPFQ